LMTAIIKDTKAVVSARAEALQALAAIKDPSATEMTAFALASSDPVLRAAGRAVKARTSPDEVLAELPALLKDDKVSLAEKQGAFAILAVAGSSAPADELLAEWLDAVSVGKVAPELMLDVLDAAETRLTTPRLKLNAPLREKIDAYRTAQGK